MRENEKMIGGIMHKEYHGIWHPMSPQQLSNLLVSARAEIELLQLKLEK